MEEFPSHKEWHAIPCVGRKLPWEPRMWFLELDLGLNLVDFPSGSVVKNLPAMQEMQEIQVWSLGQEDPLEEGKATHSSILAWRIPWTEKSGGQQSIESQRDNWSDWACMHALNLVPPLTAVWSWISCLITETIFLIYKMEIIIII